MTDRWYRIDDPENPLPKDGTEILIYFTGKGWKQVRWDSPWERNVTPQNGSWCVDDDKHGPYALRGYRLEDMKAWMPLPPPPVTP